MKPISNKTSNSYTLANDCDRDYDHPYPKLWIIEKQSSDNNDDNDNATASRKTNFITTNQPSNHMPKHIELSSEESFQWARSVSRKSLMINSQKRHPSTFQGQYKSFSTLFTNSFVIVQELALSTLYLTSHRCLVCIISFGDGEMVDERDDSGVCIPCFDDTKATTSFFIFGITFPLIAVWAITARGRQQSKILSSTATTSTTATSKKTNKLHKARIYYRTIDALMIAGMLRFLSSVLRTLTASYSSNTVMALAVGGMILHMLSCDYNFANGRNQNHHSNRSIDITYENGRPLFLGGTISINSVFCSAALLSSRCPTDSSSYLFFMATVVLFAYYPEARHVMAISFGNNFGE